NWPGGSRRAWPPGRGWAGTGDARARAGAAHRGGGAEAGPRARNHRLRGTPRLVGALAKRFTGRGLPLIDLIQEGNLGLIRAVDGFDYTKGYRFSTYATWWIRQAITKA